MRLFIAEKPDLAKAIAEGLNGEYNNTLPKNCGYIQRGNDYITWAYGHIMRLLEPHEYDEKYKIWRFEDLPIVIKDFKHKAIEDKENQLKVILRLIKNEKIKQIVHCGDADDEGQILVDEILMYSKTQKPVWRCLINDITPSAVKKEIANMRLNSEFKGMSERGFARSFADWIVGLNLTRAYTLANRAKGGEKGAITVGRVQTPILGLIVARDLENDGFKSIDYYVLNAQMNIHNIKIKTTLKVKSEEKITDINKANAIKTTCEGKQAILNISSQNKKEYPPLPYNLLTLQAEASKTLGYSAAKTLQITQSLREKHKAISYNRSDCQYLPETLYKEASKIIQALQANFSEDIGYTNVNLGIKSKAFDDSKLSAHYGIVPTETRLSLDKLSSEEKAIYTLICKRFLMQFYEPREFIAYSLNFKINELEFGASFSKTLKAGFKAFFSHISDEENVEDEIKFDINLLKNGDLANIEQVEIKKLQTKPRPLYTMTTLLKDLNSVAKYVENERIKKLLLEKDKDKKGESGGIGTPATRSDMIEKLIKQGYIEVSNDKKQVIKSTPKGKDLIKFVTPILSRPDMTALWFEYQKAIEKGETTKEAFIKSVYTSISTEIEKIKNGNFSIAGAKRIKCPECDGFLIKRKGQKGFFYGCSRYQEGCKFICMADKKGEPILKNK
ncbi:DNA topoisomerase III [Campylobacter sp. MIT 12-8780]|uniref:DNA topoisomerase 3 n=1 Tax=unclassified Campylobacter TaxID=2593542 RepID=UPI0010F81F2E|nr:MULTISPECIES: DNA topoisomerase 3 [unclassified Campylobacter]NDJ28057.1 DNA topoisomerase III [Campylobacter sp. MIT 19-121]TKX28282.1 DNA topoisomerase III [Campylobacter sp. MIT 12-5580]TQR39976.1 DNA topoisomerase III [Campylobacter sp. MIT 12-8780]